MYPENAMGRYATARLFTGTYRVMRSFDVPRPQQAHAVSSTRARLVIDLVQQEPDTFDELLRLADLDSHQTPEALIEGLQRAVGLGQLLIFEAPPSPLPRALPKKVEVPAREIAERRTWIEFRVLWDRTDKGVGQVKLQIETPDGRLQAATTNAAGVVRLEGIVPGVCHVTADATEASLDTSVTTMLPPNAARAHEPSRAARHLVAIETHRARRGETFKAFTQRIGLHWKRIAQFHFDTDDEGVAAERFAQELGSDDSAIVFLPRPWTAEGLVTTQAHVIRVAGITRPSTPFYFSC